MSVNMSDVPIFNSCTGGFKTITYKKKLKRPKAKPFIGYQNSQLSESVFDNNTCIRRITDAKLELSSTDIFDSVKASLIEGSAALNNPQIYEIICLGLGRIGECTIARYQLALLLCLKDLYDVEAYVYDPIFTQSDLKILEELGIRIIHENFEGKYKVKDGHTRLFFLPHCTRQLCNNLLWANWGLNLGYCVIICNSFHTIIENASTKELEEQVEYIAKIYPYVLELAMINSFKYYEVFNDTAIHVFPKLNLISQDLWQNCSEPIYPEKFDGMAGKLNVLRRIISELRYVLPEGHLKHSLALRYAVNQYRKYKTTDQQLCKAREEMDYMAKTYLCYLKSTRLQQEIHDEFHGKGERTVKETATMVGFKLPHDPK